MCSKLRDTCFGCVDDLISLFNDQYDDDVTFKVSNKDKAESKQDENEIVQD